MPNLFTTNKAIHSLEVANFMKAWAPAFGLNPDAAWLVGWLHDIGYSECSKGHSSYGAGMLSKFSYELSHYVSVHDSHEEVKDDMEFLLRMADLTVDETGKYLGINSRIKSINLRSACSEAEELELQKKCLHDYAVKHGYENFFNICL